MTQQVDEVSVRNHVVVTVSGEIKHYPISQLGIDFAESSDGEVLSAVAAVVREELQSEMPVESFVVSRSAENGNISIFPKTELGTEARTLFVKVLMVEPKELIKAEIKRFKKRNSIPSKRIKAVGWDQHEDFTSVIVQNGSASAIGYAKRNSFDKNDVSIGLTIATWRACRRLIS